MIIPDPGFFYGKFTSKGTLLILIFLILQTGPSTVILYKMKILYIVRHGKSAWDLPGIKDIDRPLKERGIHDAYEMAGRIKEGFSKPDILISSEAARASHTALIFKRELEIRDHDFFIEPKLYHAEVEDILEVIYGIDDSLESAMIVGHNPTFTEFANDICGSYIDNIPTSGLVYGKFNTGKWTELNKSLLVEDLFDFPKNS